MSRRIGIISTNPNLMGRTFWLFYIFTLVRNIIEILEKSFIGTTTVASLFSYFIFLYAVLSLILYARSNLKIVVLGLLLFIIGFFKLNSFVFSNNAIYIDENFRNILLTCFPHMAIAVCIVDYQNLVYRMKKYFPVYIVLAWVLMILTYSGTIEMESGDYMKIAYDIMIPIAISGYLATEKADFKYNILFFASVVALLFIGCRGAFAAVAMVYIISLFATDTTSKKLRIAVVAIFASIFLLFDQIMTFITYVLGVLGYNSRIITRLGQGTFFQSTGRDVIRSSVMNYVQNSGFRMFGIFGDRYLSKLTLNRESYIHNIVLEFVIDYGLLMGIFLIVILSATIIILWKKTDSNGKIIFSIFITITIIKLMLSNSYLIDDLFYTLLGLLISSVLIRKRYRKHYGEKQYEKNINNYL